MISLEDAVKYHKELWGWLAENPRAHKYDWPKWGGEENIDARGHCFFCEYDYQESIKGDEEGSCNYCPAIFKKLEGISTWNVDYCLGGLFKKWILTKNQQERSELAAQIRDLPTKEV